MFTKKLKSMAMLAVIALSLNSCKKGENDPFLSLRSRDSRVTGTWEMTGYEMKDVSTANEDGITSTISRTTSYSGSFMTTTTTTTGQSSNTSVDVPSYYTKRLVLEKDGMFSEITSTEQGTTKEVNGRWSWTNDKKNKTGLTLYYNENYLGSDIQTYTINQLKNKEMVLIQEDYTKLTWTNGYTEGSAITTTTFTKVQ